MKLLGLNSNQIGLCKTNVNQLLAIFRFASCKADNAKCPKAKTSGKPCEANRPEHPARKPPQKEKFVSMWETPKCDLSVAVCPPVSFDALYYKPSDKAKRIYQQTWVECPARLIQPKVVCAYPTDKYPPLERRSRKARPDTAKCMAQPTDLMSCSKKDNKKNSNCLKITLPGCRAVRSNVRCKVKRPVADCKIIKAPYPSFSECTKPPPKPRRPSECECFNIRSMCEVWTILRQKTIL